MINFFAKLLAALNANSRPGEIGGAFACGVMLALIPGGNLLWFVLFIIFFLLKIHTATMLFILLAVSGFSYLADPLFHRTGLYVLSIPALEPVFAAAADLPLVGFTSFNDSVVMGSLLWSILLWVPAYVLGVALVRVYRKKLAPRLAENRLVKAFQRVPLVRKLTESTRKVSSAWGGLSS
jgi:uncharacterized protein (TIGR03546 family)